MSKLSELFDRHAAASWDKQQALSALIGEHSWELDTRNGIITFNERLGFPAQVLGTESEVSNSWLWAWANEASPLPEKLLASAKEMRAIGEQEGIAELTQPRSAATTSMAITCRFSRAGYARRTAITAVPTTTARSSC